MTTNATVIVKAHLEKDTRRWTSSEDALTFPQVHDKIISLYDISTSMLLRYQDEDDDWVTLACPEDLEEAIASAKQLAPTPDKVTLKLDVTLIDSRSDQGLEGSWTKVGDKASPNTNRHGQPKGGYASHTSSACDSTASSLSDQELESDWTRVGDDEMKELHEDEKRQKAIEKEENNQVAAEAKQAARAAKAEERSEMRAAKNEAKAQARAAKIEAKSKAAEAKANMKAQAKEREIAKERAETERAAEKRLRVASERARSKAKAKTVAEAKFDAISTAAEEYASRLEAEAALKASKEVPKHAFIKAMDELHTNASTYTNTNANAVVPASVSLDETEVVNLSPEELVAHTKAACMSHLETHLHNHLQATSDSTYEEWIEAVHPENVSMAGIDSRFYVQTSDHLKLWNDTVDKPQQVVPSGIPDEQSLEPQPEQHNHVAEAISAMDVEQGDLSESVCAAICEALDQEAEDKVRNLPAADSQVAHLQSMGFSHQAAVHALATANGDMQQAVNNILVHAALPLDSEVSDAEVSLDSEVSEAEVHHGIWCDLCNVRPIHGARYWKQLTHDTYDVCGACYDSLDDEQKAGLQLFGQHKQSSAAEQATRDIVVEHTTEMSAPTWCVGDQALYAHTGETVTVLAVHYDDEIPYFTILMNEGSERQTVSTKLLSVDTSVADIPISMEPEDCDTQHEEDWDLLLGDLTEMGFYDSQTNREVLNETDGNIKDAVKELVKRERLSRQFDYLLPELTEMGFEDTSAARNALAKTNGDVKGAVKELIRLERLA